MTSSSLSRSILTLAFNGIHWLHAVHESELLVAQVNQAIIAAP